MMPNMNRSMESNGPEGSKVRGNAGQLYDRYTGLAREAQSQGDRVAAEGFLQYAEHYYRVLSASGQVRRPNGQPGSEGQNGGDAQQPVAAGANDTQGQPQPNAEPPIGDPDDDVPPVN